MKMSYLKDFETKTNAILGLIENSVRNLWENKTGNQRIFVPIVYLSVEV